MIKNSKSVQRKLALVGGPMLLAALVSNLHPKEWQPELLPDGQPNITGMWNNVGATATPVEMPDEFEGRVPPAEELAAENDAVLAPFPEPLEK